MLLREDEISGCEDMVVMRTSVEEDAPSKVSRPLKKRAILGPVMRINIFTNHACGCSCSWSLFPVFVTSSKFSKLKDCNGRKLNKTKRQKAKMEGVLEPNLFHPV